MAIVVGFDGFGFGSYRDVGSVKNAGAIFRPAGRGTFFCFAKRKYPKKRRPLLTGLRLPSRRYDFSGRFDSLSMAQTNLRHTSCAPNPKNHAATRQFRRGDGAGLWLRSKKWLPVFRGLKASD